MTNLKNLNDYITTDLPICTPMTEEHPKRYCMNLKYDVYSGFMTYCNGLAEIPILQYNTYFPAVWLSEEQRHKVDPIWVCRQCVKDKFINMFLTRPDVLIG